MFILFICVLFLSNAVQANDCLPLKHAYEDLVAQLAQAKKDQKRLKVLHKSDLMTETEESIIYHQLSDDHPVYQAEEKVALLTQQKRDLRSDVRSCQMG